MAFVGKAITNSKTGQSYRFIQTAESSNGAMLEMESVYGPFSKQPPLHYHPLQEEFFTVLSGELTVIINGATKIFKEGDELYIPPNTHHAMWNATDKPTVVNWKIMPALHSEYLFENITGIANKGKTNAEGKPSLLQLALTANKFSHVFRTSKPTFFIQKVLFYTLMPLAYVAGYKAVYQEYED